MVKRYNGSGFCKAAEGNFGEVERNLYPLLNDRIKHSRMRQARKRNEMKRPQTQPEQRSDYLSHLFSKRKTKMHGRIYHQINVSRRAILKIIEVTKSISIKVSGKKIKR